MWEYKPSNTLWFLLCVSTLVVYHDTKFKTIRKECIDKIIRIVISIYITDPYRGYQTRGTYSPEIDSETSLWLSRLV